MKKGLIVLCLLLMGVLGLQQAVSFTSASIENKAILKVTESENGLVAITAPRIIKLKKGETLAEFLTITNNIAGHLDYNLFYNDKRVTLDPVSGGFDKEQTIALKANESGTFDLEVKLEASWHAGKATITTIVPIIIEESPVTVPVKPETNRSEELGAKREQEAVVNEEEKPEEKEAAEQVPPEQSEIPAAEQIEAEEKETALEQAAEIENEGATVDEPAAKENKPEQQEESIAAEVEENEAK
ncbi:MAG: hypothetical protein GX922_01940 [Firmicutes bacterium]|nr:hypothetical protein [Bacillota bacterium]